MSASQILYKKGGPGPAGLSRSQLPAGSDLALRLRFQTLGRVWRVLSKSSSLDRVSLELVRVQQSGACPAVWSEA